MKLMIIVLLLLMKAFGFDIRKHLSTKVILNCVKINFKCKFIDYIFESFGIEFGG